MNKGNSSITQQQLEVCRIKLKERWSSRKPDEELLQRAWKTANEIAQLLYDEFGATHVAVFGSLSEPLGFTEASDIDIAVSGLSEKTHSKANIKLMDINTSFKIDLINFDTTKGLFRQRIQQKAIHIEKGNKSTLWKTHYQLQNQKTFPIVEEEIYEMNRKKLTQRIEDELAKIDDTLSRIQRGLDKIETVSQDVIEFIENTIATDLADIYSGFERIFERIANEIDGHTPRGSRWHKNLLEQMVNQRPERPPVISQNTYLLLEKLLEFRHKVNNIYGRELKYDNTLQHAETIHALTDTVSNELTSFTNSLTHQQKD